MLLSLSLPPTPSPSSLSPSSGAPIRISWQQTVGEKFRSSPNTLCRPTTVNRYIHVHTHVYTTHYYPTSYSTNTPFLPCKCRCQPCKLLLQSYWLSVTAQGCCIPSKLTYTSEGPASPRYIENNPSNYPLVSPHHSYIRCVLQCMVTRAFACCRNMWLYGAAKKCWSTVFHRTSSKPESLVMHFALADKHIHVIYLWCTYIGTHYSKHHEMRTPQDSDFTVPNTLLVYPRNQDTSLLIKGVQI